MIFHLLNKYLVKQLGWKESESNELLVRWRVGKYNVAEMLATSGEAGIDLITELINWEISSVVNCYKSEGYALDWGKVSEC